ncbi:Retrovirus-related Pol polyprotein from type-1 retrotransposable element R1 [Araneus ventricosus]|uniref:Retrovirus-related Pol polyprotein from type-1 retrotransposable element R1 n=1 Tax=Araneus ventricosus TaxID=182803 RepID=A0A4Y2HMF2_ARAVE|nr:Retrovirus-related Pol polyprotein from type-1 retrotransposable element R1 [Araneus ventricosus]
MGRQLRRDHSRQPFGVHFDTAKDPNRRPFQLSSVRKKDGSLTATMDEALHKLLSYHFPDDTALDTPAQASIRRNSKIPPYTPDDPPSPLEVEAAVREIRSKKAPVPDGLYGDVINEAFAINKSFLVDFFNCCLEQGYFSKRWRTAQLVLFNKPNKEDTEPSAFHPICLLNALGKVLDKLVTKRLYHHLLKLNHLQNRQYGFVSGRSATDAILELKSWIHKARDEAKHSVIISLDVQSAFNRVWWPLVLVHNLRQINCPRNIFKTVASFLEDRSVSFTYGDITNTKSYTIGCPQGSNSGPLLWLLIANDASSSTSRKTSEYWLMRMIFISLWQHPASTPSRRK